MPVANPDGYDFTFQPGQRLWRKNLRDNNGDGEIAPGDGVDLNRNFADEVGLRQRGLLAQPRQRDLPRPRPGLRARDAGARRVRAAGSDFEFLVNYHSAAELLLYGTGWQVSTPTPDDVIYEAMAGDDAEPAVPGYDPDISAELYTTNGDTDTHMTESVRHARLHAGDVDVRGGLGLRSRRRVGGGGLRQRLRVPRRRGARPGRVREEHPVRPVRGRVRRRPGRPGVGRRAATRRTSSSTASRCPTATRRRSRRSPSARCESVRFHYRVNGGPDADRRRPEWGGGERYGDENDDYYAEFRGTVRGRGAGDQVEVWFTGVKTGHGRDRDVESEHVHLHGRGGQRAATSWSSPTRTTPASTRRTPPASTRPSTPRHTSRRSRPPATTPTSGTWTPRACRTTSACSATTTRCVWYLGDNRLTQDPEDELISTPFGQLPDIAVAERQQYLTMAVRDYLNEGGKLVHAGETAQYSGPPGHRRRGRWPLLRPQRRPEAECVIDLGPRLLRGLPDPGRRLPAVLPGRLHAHEPRTARRRHGRRRPDRPATRARSADPVVDGANPLDEAGVFQPTSDVLPVARVPAVRQRGRGRVRHRGVDPFAPVEGTGTPGRARRLVVHAPVQDGRPAAARARPNCGSSSRSTPSRPTTTSSWRPARPGRTTGRRCPTSTAAPQTDPPAECEPRRVPARAPPVPAPLPRRAPAAPTGHAAALELVHRLDRRLAPGRVRPLRLRAADRSSCRSAT